MVWASVLVWTSAFGYGMAAVGNDEGEGGEKGWIEVNVEDKKMMVMMSKETLKPRTPRSGTLTRLTLVLGTAGAPLCIHRAEYGVNVEKAMNLNLPMKPCSWKDLEAMLLKTAGRNLPNRRLVKA